MSDLGVLRKHSKFRYIRRTSCEAGDILEVTLSLGVTAIDQVVF